MIDTSRPTNAQPQPELAATYDVIIMGGGPAGATVANLLASYGHDVLLLDRENFPRFHVGESLIPETYHTLERLGVVEALQESRFPKKFSVQFVTETGKESRPFYFDEYKDHASSQTWQVERGPFDRLLLESATSRGATAHTDAQVLDVLFDDTRAVGVRVKLGGAQPETREIGAQVVVDATGQTAFLMHRLGLKVADPRLRKGTVWTYYRGALRDPGRDEGATIILQTAGKKSWFWYIPLPDDIVSVGCTGDLDYLFSEKQRTSADVFEQELQRCPGMVRRTENAERVTDYFTTKDFSYSSERGAGDGWLLVGDAFSFIDPVYSSGVYLALRSGEFAADAVHEALSAQDTTGERLGSWQGDYRTGVEQFRKLVYAFYSPGFSFAEFLKKHPEYQSNVVDILIGDVFKPGVGDMFAYMPEVFQSSDGVAVDEMA